ncbi:hypothetical protein BH11BAC6_BH11BAC6_15020 [soil metagenome]
MLIAQLRTLCNYVNTVATTQEAVASSGFDQSKVPEPRHIYAPAAPKVSPGMNPGTINSQIIAVKGATGYLHQYLATDAPAGTEWTSFGTSRAKFTFDKLQSGVVYRVRVIVLGSNQQVAYSPESVQVSAI